ncbi:MAG: methylmalonyl Co-A mutase-associated GTPase MeaB, partial [Actinomycetota bacterium]|nr:methylmalonyl Co-A mutase-associated GTPase MeaB [Actinomycetota bacterium]
MLDGIRAGRRAAVAQAITLVESRRPAHRAAARELLTALVEGAGVDSPTAGVRSTAVRVGISGVPGVGKSTFIEALGTRLTGEGHRVGVLAVDPSSVRTGGSVLGDKTRMARLAADSRAFIRPSPSAGTLGGVARATVQAMTVLEAAGYDVILVETVGVGQSEVTVAGMVDTFLFLTLARTGDQLQGIKKGVLELADLISVNKADGDHRMDAKRAARELTGALRLIYPPDALWRPPVLTTSAIEGEGLREFWDAVLHHQQVLGDAGELA